MKSIIYRIYDSRKGFFSLAYLIVSTVLVCTGKIDGNNWTMTNLPIFAAYAAAITIDKRNGVKPSAE
jgi:hypothetical protein